MESLRGPDITQQFKHSLAALKEEVLIAPGVSGLHCVIAARRRTDEAVGTMKRWVPRSERGKDEMVIAAAAAAAVGAKVILIKGFNYAFFRGGQ